MNSHLFTRSFFSNAPQDLHCRFEPERGSFSAHLADAVRELELAFDISNVACRSNPVVSLKKEWTRKMMGSQICTCHGGCRQICRVMWADKYWILTHSKMHLGKQMMKEWIEEAERWDLEPKKKKASPWWTSIYAGEKLEDMMIKTKRAAQIAVREKCQGSGVHQSFLAIVPLRSIREHLGLPNFSQCALVLPRRRPSCCPCWQSTWWVSFRCRALRSSLCPPATPNASAAAASSNTRRC